MSEERDYDIRTGPDGGPWCVVAVARGEAEEAILKGVLDSAGIPCWVARESAAQAIPVGIGLLGMWELLVPSSRCAEALDLLEGVPVEEGEDAPSEDDAPFEDDEPDETG